MLNAMDVVLQRIRASETCHNATLKCLFTATAKQAATQCAQPPLLPNAVFVHREANNDSSFDIDLAVVSSNAGGFSSRITASFKQRPK